MKGFDTPIKKVRVPIEAIWSELGQVLIKDMHTVSLYRKISSGSEEECPPWETKELAGFYRHFKELEGEDTAQARCERRLKSIKGLLQWGEECDYEFTLPAVLDFKGRFRILDGHRRAALAISRGKKDIELEVMYVSPLWLELEQRLARIYGKNTLYQPIDHPWFSDWAVSRSPERFDLIKKFLDSLGFEGWASKSHIDIGSCTGWLCRNFSKSGFQSIGFDFDPNVVFVADYLNNVFGTNCTFYNSNGFKILKQSNSSFRVITCLSVLHHYMWEEAGTGYKTFMDSLDLMLKRANIVFIDLTTPTDKRVRVKNIPTEVGAFEEWAKRELGVGICVNLGHSKNDFARPLLALSRMKSREDL